MLPEWVSLSLTSALGYGASSVSTTQAQKNHGISSTAFTSCTHIVATIMFAILVFVPLPFGLSKNVKTDTVRAFTSRLPIAAAIALMFWVGDVALNTAYPRAPNPGYCDSVSDLESVLGAFLAYFIFASPLSKKQVMGMLLAVFSLHFLQ